MKIDSDKNIEAEPDFLASLPPSEIKTFEDAVAWLHKQNPDMENNHPEDLDWQAIKAAGRRY